jgi:hypothetical protein
MQVDIEDLSGIFICKRLPEGGTAVLLDAFYLFQGRESQLLFCYFSHIDTNDHILHIFEEGEARLDAEHDALLLLPAFHSVWQDTTYPTHYDQGSRDQYVLHLLKHSDEVAFTRMGEEHLYTRLLPEEHNWLGSADEIITLMMKHARRHREARVVP